ncbi:lipid A phosphoethanolamine transferase [Flavobacterium agrisoli]|uniref:Lipid A phosphoethanolamine transferase n=1 Tax=Flavobacterium agrisoli TaxID=2793066 RepID=A0A934PKU2_9FLAO|nr:lipid A phosphoethanolamine transferase [Flavobacterium agrisoli]MBK0368346.1 lipid A phosphoethanolamine transferase [Flavobacterium agrisoli]
MKKFLLSLGIFLFLNIQLRAQAADSSNVYNVFNQPRYHYFFNSVVLFNEYLDTDNGSYNTTNARLLLPIGDKSWNFRADLPLVSANTNHQNKTGLGDISASVAFIPILGQHHGLSVKARIYANTAVDPAFGTGKWLFVPTVFYGHYFDKAKKVLLISSLEYQTSFAGSSNQSDVNTTIFENAIYWFQGKNWFAVDAAFRYNNTLDGFQNNAYLEFGRKITKENMIYIHPSVAFGGEKSYNYGFECGVLILF